MKTEKGEFRPHSYIKKVEKRGYAYIPVKLQEELGILKDSTYAIPVFIDANVVFMLRKGARRDEVLKGLKILIQDIELRWKDEKEEHKMNVGGVGVGRTKR